MNNPSEIVSSGESTVESHSSEMMESEKAKPTKKKLLEEYQDHVGGGGFHSWLSWTHCY